MPVSSVALCRAVARFAHQRGKPATEGSLQPLDVGGVDECLLSALGGSEPLSHFSLRAVNHAPKDPDHPSAGVPLERLGDLNPLRQEKLRPSSLAAANRLAKYLERLLLG
jgi:hypothetical protein